MAYRINGFSTSIKTGGDSQSSDNVHDIIQMCVREKRRHIIANQVLILRIPTLSTKSTGTRSQTKIVKKMSF